MGLNHLKKQIEEYHSELEKWEDFILFSLRQIEAEAGDNIKVKNPVREIRGAVQLMKENRHKMNQAIQQLTIHRVK